MKTAHTPRPWRKSPKAADAIVADVPTGTGFDNSSVEHYGGYLIAESIAPQNRPLIEAAPDLLHHLEVLSAEDSQVAPDWVQKKKAARAAIAKAKGELRP